MCKIIKKMRNRALSDFNKEETVFDVRVRIPDDCTLYYNNEVVYRFYKSETVSDIESAKRETLYLLSRTSLKCSIISAKEVTLQQEFLDDMQRKLIDKALSTSLFTVRL